MSFKTFVYNSLMDFNMPDHKENGRYMYSVGSNIAVVLYSLYHSINVVFNNNNM